MKKIVLAATIAAFSAGAVVADTVRMGTEGAYPPYNFINDDGEVDGLERELGDRLCEIAGLDCVWDGWLWAGAGKLKHSNGRAGVLADPCRT